MTTPKESENMTEKKKYLVEYTASLLIDADDVEDARKKANEITDAMELGDIELDYPDVEWYN